MTDRRSVRELQTMDKDRGAERKKKEFRMLTFTESVEVDHITIPPRISQEQTGQ